MARAWFARALRTLDTARRARHVSSYLTFSAILNAFALRAYRRLPSLRVLATVERTESSRSQVILYAFGRYAPFLIRVNY